MKQLFLLMFFAGSLSSCVSRSGRFAGPDRVGGISPDTLITHSLFQDRSATISEEGIQQILNGSFRLPEGLRVAIVRLESPQAGRHYYWNDEAYLKTQQSYLDLFSGRFRQSPRVSRLSVIPDLLISRTPSFTGIREAAVRMQADIVVVYSITGDIYARYKLFSRTELKAFATTQLIILDVRTGLVPFSTIVTRDYLARKDKEELNESEARSRVQHEAVLLTISEIGDQITDFLQSK